MSTDTPMTPDVAKSKTRALLGIVVGAPIGALVWALGGLFSGAVLMLLVGAIMTVTSKEGYLPYHASLMGDVWYLAKWAAVIFAAPGALAGLLTGIVVGYKGEPMLAGILRGSWNCFGTIAKILGLGAKGARRGVQSS